MMVAAKEGTGENILSLEESDLNKLAFEYVS